MQVQSTVFYGITKEGKPYFENNQYHLSFNADTGQERKVSENFVISVNDNKATEYLMSIGYDTNIEIYDLNQKKVISKIATNTWIGNKDIMDCVKQAGINYYNGSNYFLYYGYLTLDCDFFLKKLSFDSPDISSVSIPLSTNLNKIRGKIASCYMTKNKYIICIIIKYFYLTFSQVNAVVYDINLNSKINVQLDSYTQKAYLGGYPYFIKSIHLKEEIGVFAFYRFNGLTMSNYPVLLFKNYQNNKLQDYISAITLNKKEFNTENLFNDLIRINENKICFMSPSENKEEMYIVLITIFDSNVAIRYYCFNIFSIYEFKFYASISLSLYNNYIASAFSFCRTETCTSSKAHYPGFMVFSYPNGTDASFNLIDYMFSKNAKVENYTIDLKNNIRIDNNIFGLVYSTININKYINCGSIKFSSSVIDYVNIIEGYTLAQEENIVAKEIPIEKITCSIEYSYFVTEPGYDEYNSYVTQKVFLNSYNEDYFEQEKDRYESRLLYYNLIINEEITESCDDNNCLVCKSSNRTLCLVCKYKFVINKDENGKYKSCLDEGVNISIAVYYEEEETEKPSNKKEEEDEEDLFVINYISSDAIKLINYSNIYSLKETDIDYTDKVISDYLSTEINIDNTVLNNYIIDRIMNNELKNETLTTEQIIEVYKKLKEEYFSGNYSGQSKVVSTENVIYQISTFEHQLNNEDPNISSIDLGSCENKLKKYYNLENNDSLLIFKMDLKSEDQKQTFVHYEIYHPYNYSLLNLSLCDSKIIVNTPVDLSDNSIKLYESLLEYGYNIFDSGDDFYNDICSVYTTINGTDMLIEDRKKNIYYNTGNITMCQTGCDFILYNTTTKKSKCDCDIKAKTELVNNDITEKHFSSKKLASEFSKTITNSNFRVLKCYKLALDTKKLFKNIGRIIMTLIFVQYLISLFYYIIKERKKIDEFINLIIKNKEDTKLNFEPNEEKITIKGKDIDFHKEKNFNKKIKSKTNSKKRRKNFPPKKKGENRKEKKYEIKKEKKNNLIKSSLRNINTNTNIVSHLTKKLDDKNININIYPVHNVHNTHLKKSNKKNENKYKMINNNNSLSNNNLILSENYLNDQELNSLDYYIAIELDKRSYLQYYWSLLKKKHLILFALLPANDYNLFSLKIALFLLSISLYFTVNGFFFTDSSMHKVNENNGKFDFIYQIPQILYSSIISAIINMLLKLLSLSEKNILVIKQEKDIIKARKEEKKIKRCIIIKFIIFFLLSNLLLLFFWYFISCFCAVYTNTQKILFKDIIISFALSMIYPFGLNLIPGLFRIPALRDEKHNSKYLYNISGYIALI